MVYGQSVRYLKEKKYTNNKLFMYFISGCVAGA